MKAYVIAKNGCEYNDQTYDARGIETVTAAYRDRAKAQAECDRLTGEEIRQYGDELVDEDGKFVGGYQVLEVEFDESQSEGGEFKAYLSARDKRKKAQEEAAEVAKAAFTAGIAAVFAAHPVLEGIRWTQYTPYFNDGDTCTFGCHIEDGDVKWAGEFRDGTEENEDGDEDGLEEDALYIFSDKRKATDPKTLAKKAIIEFSKQFEDGDYLSMFGDHAQVTITRDGSGVKIDSEDYDHD